MPQSITDGALAWQRLAVLNAHPRDERIQFEEETHTYTIDGVRRGWVSCTGFWHHFFGEFDADAVIAKMMKSPKWPSSPYYGMTPAAIKKKWDDKRDASSAAGTRMHLDIEHCYNAMPAFGLEYCHWTLENGKDGMLADEWVPAGGAEWDYFCDFQQSHVAKRGLIPYRTEWLVFDEEHRVAGSIDMVYRKPDGTLAIYDWKRVEELKTENSFQSGLGPLSHLPDTNYWHYSIQLNVYRAILERYYGEKVTELALVVLHPANKSWRVARLNMMDQEVADMFAARAAALRLSDGSNPVVVF